MTRLPITKLPGQRLYNTDKMYSKTLSLEDIHEISVIHETSDPDRLYTLLDKLLEFDLSKLTTYDFTYYMHWLRIQSYAFIPSNAEWVCPFCKKHQTSDIKDSLIINNIRDDYDDHVAVKLFSCEAEVKIRYLTVGDLIKCSTYTKIHDINLNILHASCQLDLGNNESFEDKIKFVQNLKADDSVILQEVETQMRYGVEPYIIKSCVHCKKEDIRVKLSLTLDRFLPQNFDSHCIRDRIFFKKEDRISKSNEGGLLKDNLDETSVHAGAARKGKKKKQEKPMTVKDIVNKQ